MTRVPKRRRMFGPLFYVTAAVGVVGLAVRASLYFSELSGEFGTAREMRGDVKSPDPRARNMAFQNLRSWRPEESLPIIMAEAKGASAVGRADACRELGFMGRDFEVVGPVLIDACGDSRLDVRTAAVGSLGTFLTGSGGQSGGRVAANDERLEAVREEALRVVVRLLREDPDDLVRVAAVNAVSASGGQRWVGALEAAIKDHDRAVRMAAACALAGVKGADDPAVVGTLRTIVADPNPVPDRRPAFEKIMNLGNERLKDQAISALAELLPVCEPGVLTEVMGCLEVAGARAVLAVPALEKLMKDNEDPSVRGRAAIAVADIMESPDLIGVGDGAFARAMGGTIPGPRHIADGKNHKAYSPRIAGMLAGIVADETMAIELREAAFGRLHGVNPEALANASRSLIRQLTNKDQNIRVMAQNLLGMIVEEVAAELPDATERSEACENK